MTVFPEFDDDGFLPAGVFRCTGEQFLERFLATSARQEYRQTILNILDYAAHYGAISVLIGGSFVTAKPDPRDIDCVILFESESQIPPRIESLDIGGNSVDIFFASNDHPELVKSFQRLLSTSRFGDKSGVIDIMIRRNGRPAWDITWEPDEEIYEVVRRVYIRRHFVEKTRRSKTLVTIHGIMSHAEWNAEIALHASANGWTVAPFHYGYTYPTIFINSAARRAIVDRFRDFLADLSLAYGAEDVSIIAHSLGTYIALSYLLGFDDPPVRFDTLILCGAIVDHNLDLDSLKGKVANIVNEQAPNDEWVEMAKKSNLFQDKLFGYAGTRGFLKASSRLIQSSSDIFTHNNVIKRDVVARRWMPLLEANRGSVTAEAMQMLMDGFRKE